MIQAVKQSGHHLYGIVEYVIDSVADLDDLPIDIPMGSSALVIATSDVYILSGNKEWVLL